MRKADNLPPFCAVVTKSGNLNFLEPSGPVMGVLYLYLYYALWVYVCSLSFPARNAHAPYCHLWPAPLYGIFPRVISGMIFERKLPNKMCILSSSTTLKDFSL